MQVTHNGQRITDTYATFVEGQVVKLVIGGPDLLVLASCEDCGEVEVAWIDPDGDIAFSAFPDAALVSVH